MCHLLGNISKIHFFVPFNVVERQSLTFNNNSTVTLGEVFFKTKMLIVLSSTYRTYKHDNDCREKKIEDI